MRRNKLKLLVVALAAIAAGQELSARHGHGGDFAGGFVGGMAGGMIGSAITAPREKTIVVQQPVMTPPESYSPEIDSLRRDNAALASENDALRAKNRDLRRQIADLEDELGRTPRGK